MRIQAIIGFAAAAAMTFVLATPASVSAQPPAPSPETQAQPPAPPDQAREAQPLRSPVEGELIEVDADAKMITIQPADGPEVTIAYTDATEISGAQKDAAGLATMKDARVAVHFTEDAETKKRTANRIVVHPKS